MNKALLILTFSLLFVSSTVFSAENPCSKYKKWNLPTGKYNACIKELKKEGKYEEPKILSDIRKKISDVNKKYKDFRKENAPKTGEEIWNDFKKN